jgi:hypothetical protein
LFFCFYIKRKLHALEKNVLLSILIEREQEMSPPPPPPSSSCK